MGRFTGTEAQHVRGPSGDEVDFSVFNAFPLCKRPMTSPKLHRALRFVAIGDQVPRSAGTGVARIGLQNLRTKSFGACNRQIPVALVR